ncbi:M20 family peptidase [Paraglaciecola marina]|uniref:M20 family peptidase n=1 Tax=Paraglaciecola marina TaxID=2500157 RepID=UPI00105D8C0F|nr:M20 family peptidase [Paraglaciecola marina]
MKKILLFLTVIIIAVVAVVFYRANTVFENNQYQVTEALHPVEIDETAALHRFADAIKIKTISYDDATKLDPESFLAFHQHLADSFPLVHQQTRLQKFADYSLVFHLKGQNSQLKPVLFMGHMDVVPVDPNTAYEWLQPPFSGNIVDGTIWGRGTIDDKVTVLALMESLEIFLAKGITPQRDIYFSFGHDEEAGGNGAKVIAKHFAEQNIEFEYILDEGGLVTQGIVAGTSAPIAVIGVAEKGFVNFDLTVKSKGGHSSQPPAHTAAGILAAAIVKVENNPFAESLEFLGLMFDNIGYSMPLSQRLPLTNLWLLGPLVKSAVLSSPTSAASTRTTTAVTMLQGSTKSNVLPTVAKATVNFRILPGDTVESIRAHLEEVIDDPRVELSASLANEASSVSPTVHLGYKLIESTIRRIDDSILVTPYLVVGATDSRHFQGLSDNIYRFMMVSLNQDTLSQFHGLNEQISVQNYLSAIQFYYALLEQTAAAN